MKITVVGAVLIMAAVVLVALALNNDQDGTSHA